MLQPDAAVRLSIGEICGVDSLLATLRDAIRPNSDVTRLNSERENDRVEAAGEAFRSSRSADRSIARWRASTAGFT